MEEYNEPEQISVGRVNKLFGTNGEVMVTLYDGFDPENNSGPVFVEVDGLPTPFFYTLISRRGRNKAVVSFDDLDTEARVSVLIGKEFYILAEPDTDDVEGSEEDSELYLADLEGFGIILDYEGREVAGTITEYIDSELNPLFNIEIDNIEYLIPAADDLITSIDTDKEELRMSIPDGLLDL
ncbi:MAG: 16S rRNA processing protein RimM [Rikenellaceae bacterium]|nr:16S rRNA processing protein RimM [Rikenellaceae bacterium]